MENNNPPPPSGALVILSGGQDSTTCLFQAMRDFETVHAVTFDYGQRHRREIAAAERVFQHAKGYESHYGCRLGEHWLLPIPPGTLRSTSPLVTGAEPAQYAGPDDLPGGLEATFVPMRNLLFLVVAANLAYSLGSLSLVTGVCQEDFGGYPDCRESFIQSAQSTLIQACAMNDDEPWARLRIVTPLMNLTKKQTVELATELPGAYSALALTHTAYDGRNVPDGRDHASLLRLKGFLEAGLPDPLVIAAVLDGRLPSLPQAPNYSNEAFARWSEIVLRDIEVRSA